MNYQSKCEMCFWRKKSHGSKSSQKPGATHLAKYLRIGQAKNEKSVSFIHFDMERFPLSVFHLLYLMKLWMHGIKSRIGPISNDFVCVMYALWWRTHRNTKIPRKKSNLISAFTYFLSFVLEYIWRLVYMNVSKSGARLGRHCVEWRASTMNFHCCWGCSNTKGEGAVSIFTLCYTNPFSICSGWATTKKNRHFHWRW